MIKGWIISHLEKKKKSHRLLFTLTHSVYASCLIKVSWNAANLDAFKDHNLCEWTCLHTVFRITAHTNREAPVSVEITLHCDNDSWFIHPAGVSLSKPLYHFQLCKRPCSPNPLWTEEQNFPTALQKVSHFLTYPQDIGIYDDRNEYKWSNPRGRWTSMHSTHCTHQTIQAVTMF